MQARLFINRTIGELLFDGYENEVMKIADNFANYSDEDHDEKYDDGYIEAKDKVKTESSSYGQIWLVLQGMF